ncbi:hypothetical protein [Saccharopolyspora hattusasensis]|uniref:hypothetical protein n=1 Tax=Saccharopolyspora hattusasensis TaxID=1128679 RepID=UPI003D980FE9
MLLIGDSAGGDSPFGGQAPGRLLSDAPGTYEPLGSVEVGSFPLTIASSTDGTRA